MIAVNELKNNIELFKNESKHITNIIQQKLKKKSEKRRLKAIIKLKL